MDAIKTAQEWREQKGYSGRGGIVVLHDGKVSGWQSALRDASHWVPGCIAVAEDGQSWTSIVGTERDGCLMWLPNDSI